MEKKQVVVVHGGDVFRTYSEYITFLKAEVIDSLADFMKVRWRDRLQDILGEGYEVIAPKMPNKSNAKYEEWRIWFEKLLPFLTDGVMLIGHSLGGIFLAKYLSENDFPKKVRATFLVAAPYDEKDAEYKLVDFKLPRSLEGLIRQGGEIFLYHSKDDPVVPFVELGKYQKALPQASAKVFEDRQHFAQSEFLEIIKDIQNFN